MKKLIKRGYVKKIIKSGITGGNVGIYWLTEKGKIEVALGLPVCVDKSSKVAISKQVGGRWHLIGWGNIL